MRQHPFRYESIREVYDKENRKGNIDLAMLPDDYCEIIKNIQKQREELSLLKRISTKKMDEDAKAAHYSLMASVKDKIRNLYDSKDLKLTDILLNIEKRLNDGSYFYTIERDEAFYTRTKKECFHTKGDVLESMILSKLLCLDLASAFKVKTSNRHHILSCIKAILAPEKHFLIIRTDIENFFESIPHKLILTSLKANPIVANKTIGCIKSVLSQYDKIKSSGIQGAGVPRGVAVSSYISEIVMRDFDMSIQKRPNVMFYARYVDDIIIILSHTQPGLTLDDFFMDISKSVEDLGLKLHPKGSSKSTFIDYNPYIPGASCMEYLGYRIKFNQKDITFHLSQRRYDRIKKRLDNAFGHFKSSYKRDPKKARIDLIDCLNLLSGNTCLHKTKHGVKTGLFFSNDLISRDNKQLCSIQAYYVNKLVNNLDLDEKPFGNGLLKDKYLNRLKSRLLSISFSQRWKDKKMFSFSVKRMKELTYILGE